MQFSSNTDRRNHRLHKTKIRATHTLQFYSKPPIDNISLEDFERFAIDRLKVLKGIENALLRYQKNSPEYEREMTKLYKAFLPNVARQELDNADAINQEIRKDHISHFILRLAYCRSENLRRWFLMHEMELFKYRFNQESAGGIDSFLKANNLEYTPIPENEKMSIRTELIHSNPMQNGAAVESKDYYKVPFTEALDLVKLRKIYLKNGQAYVPRDDLVTIVISVFRANLSHALAMASKALPFLEEDDRILPKLSNLSRQYIGKDYSAQPSLSGQVVAGDIDGLSAKSFPLCMKQLHESLRENHHLTHGGRMQYGLFLKGIGLSLEEALRFWREEFTKGPNIDADKFDKQYAYNIRHNYGKEGKRTNYTPYSCMKIIMSNPPGPRDYHGCPFRHTDPDLLRQRLLSNGLSSEGAKEITELAKGSHYQLACVRYYELVHNVSDAGFSINHPNEYFEESQRVQGANRPNTRFAARRINTTTNTSETETKSVTKDEDILSKTADSLDDEIDEFLSNSLVEITE
ncbi:DNA primase large subunit [Trichoplax sp. H2]|nr:DNA primase large subunit [Trichoplax sp. H2]|eukprot:RDD46235.1 DNA primase large subunit [Trichoplax sp. H2]